MTAASGPGLRERKKAKTRSAIQRHALRLFREQGYHETTVEQVAEAAEISPSTFFRYFHTKESVVLWDDLDPLFFAAFRSQPAEVSPATALRTAARSVFEQVPDEAMREQRERAELLLRVPELRAAALDQFVEAVPLICRLVAERTGRSPDDVAVRAFAGAVMGVAFAVILAAAEDPSSDLLEALDAGFAQLEAGLPL